MSHYYLPLFFALASVPSYSLELDHPAHEHGNATLMLVQDDHVLVLEFDSPTGNIWGFEHPPQNEHDRAAIRSAVSVLTERLPVMLPAEAGCVLSKQHLQLPEHSQAVFETHEHEHPDSQQTVHSHADLHASWEINCERVSELNDFDILLFKQFPLIERIKIEALFDVKAIATEVTPDQFRIKVR